MKTILPIIILTLISPFQTAMAQSTDMVQLTNYYLGIKDALVSENGSEAQEMALLFLQHMDVISGLSKNEENLLKRQKSKLTESSKAISLTKDVTVQRQHLNALSTAFYTLLKDLNHDKQEIFYQYCPMKDSYWLSTEKTIKNPYYGKNMIACGKVIEKHD